MIKKHEGAVFYDLLTDKLQDGKGGVHTNYYIYPGSYWAKNKTVIKQ